MELNQDLLDTVDLTARLRRHPRYCDLREGFLAEGLDFQSAYLLTLDGLGPNRGLGLLIDGNENALEFTFEGVRVKLKLVESESDSLIRQTMATLRDQAARAQLERAIAEYPL